MTLNAEVFVSPPIDVNPTVVFPITGRVQWSPISSTLIYGEREAILIDTPITEQQNETLAAWIQSKLGLTRRLSTIYITHGHADHFMGISLLKKRFPGCRALATASTVDHMKQQLEPNYFQRVWGLYFSSQIPDRTEIEIAEPLTTDEILVEGHALKVVELGHTDTYASTALFAPDLGLAVCGDAVYGDVHQMLREANTPQKRQEWIDAVQKIRALQPRSVVAGHKQEHDEDSVMFLDKTIEYIRDFGKFVEETRTAKELFDRMMDKYSGRMNPAALELGCHSAHPSNVDKV